MVDEFGWIAHNNQIETIQKHERYNKKGVSIAVIINISYVNTMKTEVEALD